MKLDIGNPPVNNRTNILDIEIPPKLENNVSTGWPEIDMLFSGDGIMPSTVCLLTGLPGSGKSSLAIRLADSITGAAKLGKVNKGGICIYNGLEESFYQVRRITKRLGFKHGFTPSYETDVNLLIKKCEEIESSHPGRQLFLFVDSLPCLEMKPKEVRRGRPKGAENLQVDIIQELTTWAKRSYAVVFVLGHVNKKGEFQGKQALKHIVDVHLHLGWDRDHQSETYGERIACVEKNRTGTSGLYYPFEVNGKGFYFTRTSK